MKLSPLATVALVVAMVALVLGTAVAMDDPPMLELENRLGDLQLEVEGDIIYVLVNHNGETLRLTATEYLEALEATRQRQQEQGLLFVLFNITTWVGVLWVSVGLGGQVLFTGRMVLQWIASERYGQSIVPPMFWWLSLIGATMLIFYFIWRKDIVGTLGQATGWFIYVRNIWMIRTRPALQYKPLAESAKVGA